MTEYQKLVVKLLVMIWKSIHQVPGTAVYGGEREFIASAEDGAK